MERIKEAIKLAKQQQGESTKPTTEPLAQQAPKKHAFAPAQPAAHVPRLLQTRPAHLAANRIVASKTGTPEVAVFDMLRTRILGEMDKKGWKVVMVTSPTMECGKTVTAINLALSIARQPERRTFLIDLDLRRPHVASYLGVDKDRNFVDAFEQDWSPERGLLHIDIAGAQLAIASNKQPARRPVEVIASRQLKMFIETLRLTKEPCTIIVDMPPVLVSDDVLAFSGMADCYVLVVAEGMSTIKEIDSSQKLLAGVTSLGCVLTKSREPVHSYYQ